MNSKQILSIFTELSQIPRTSKHEQEIGNWIVKYVKERNLKYKQDDAGNIVASLPATKGYEEMDGYVLQGHMDMVGQKTKESKHDFTKDPIIPYVDGDWLKAKGGTTLGADNGIGIAMGLALIDSEVSHPALELLFTVDEETGLTGAQKLSSGFLTHKNLLNLDSEEDCAITIGCAGSTDSIITKKYHEISVHLNTKSYKLSLHGGKGGHSGIEIHKKIASTNVLMARLLAIISQELKVSLISLKGGTVRNGIAASTELALTINEFEFGRFKVLVDNYISGVIKSEYAKVEPNLELTLFEIDNERALSEGDTKQLINLMNVVPHGVLSMSNEVEGLVESSNNFALISLENGAFSLTTMTRSSVASKLEEIKNRMRCLSEIVNGSYDTENPSPSWQPDPNAKLLEKVKNAYKEIYGKNPTVEACHAGLECGAIGAKYKGMEMVSIGPEILGAHTPKEKLNLKSFEEFIKVLTWILAN